MAPETMMFIPILIVILGSMIILIINVATGKRNVYFEARMANSWVMSRTECPQFPGCTVLQLDSVCIRVALSRIGSSLLCP